MRYLPLVAIAILSTAAAAPAFAQERNVGDVSIRALEPPVDVRPFQDLNGPVTGFAVPIEGRSVFAAPAAIIQAPAAVVQDLTDGQ